MWGAELESFTKLLLLFIALQIVSFGVDFTVIMLHFQIKNCCVYYLYHDNGRVYPLHFLQVIGTPFPFILGVLMYQFFREGNW